MSQTEPSLMTQTEPSPMTRKEVFKDEQERGKDPGTN